MIGASNKSLPEIAFERRLFPGYHRLGGSDEDAERVQAGDRTPIFRPFSMPWELFLAVLAAMREGESINILDQGGMDETNQMNSMVFHRFLLSNFHRQKTGTNGLVNDRHDR